MKRKSPRFIYVRGALGSFHTAWAINGGRLVELQSRLGRCAAMAGHSTVARWAPSPGPCRKRAVAEIDYYVMAITAPERFACDDPLHSHTGSWMEVCDALDAYLGHPGFVEHLGRRG